MEKVIIIGIGNILRRDDGVGVHVAKALEGAIIPPNPPLSKGGMGGLVEVYDGGLGGFKLLDLIRGAKKAIFIDAIEMNLPPGTVRAFSQRDVASLLTTKRCSLHDPDLLEVIRLAEMLDDAPEIKIVGIQPATVEAGLGLSTTLKDSIQRTISLILDII